MGLKAIGVLLLAFYVTALTVWGQEQTSPPALSPDEPAASAQPTPPQAGDAEPAIQSEQEPQGAPRQSLRPVPVTLALPAGTLIPVRINQWLSSDRNHAGDTFSAVLDQPIVAHGWVVARRGQAVMGRVDVAQKASQGNGVSQLGLEITELTLVDGEQLPVSTEMQQAVPPPAYPGSAERNVATVGTTAVLGAIVGAAVGGRQGAAIGAGLGAAAGVAAVLYSRGRPTVVAPETLLSFRLEAPVTISTEPGAVAFQPVTPSDYEDQDAYANAPQRHNAGRGYPPPYDYGYCGPWGWDCYPGPYFGPYIGIEFWEFGPRFGGFGRFR
jgi:hypothetical protein